MLLRSEQKHPKLLMQIGLLLLILASLARWGLHPGPHLSEGLADGVTGFLYGTSIACMLLHLVAQRRRST